MLKNVTITLPEEVALWARKRAAEKNTSVSRFVGEMLAEEMRRNDEYWEAYRQWQKLKPTGINARNRMTREEAHARR